MKKIARLEGFDFYDASGIEKHLEKMAEKGWLLCESSGLWFYQRIKPQNIKFAVTYFYKASDYNPYPSIEQEVFYSYCESAGWKLIAESGQMQIFSSTDENPIPIETDEAIKLNLIQSIMKRSLLFWSIFLVILITDIFQLMNKIINDPLHSLSNADNFIFILIYIWGLLLICNEIFRYTRWYHKSLKAVEMGKTCCDVKKRNLWLNFLLPCLILLLIMIWTKSIALLIVLAICLAVVITGIALSIFINKGLKKYSATYWENLSLSLLSVLVVLFILYNPIANTLNRLYEEAKWENSETVMLPDQFGNMKEWKLIQDELPLTLKDMNAAEDTFYAYEKSSQETFLLSYLNASQSTVYEGRMKTILDYEIVDIKAGAIYDLCLNALMRIHINNGTYWQQVNDPCWQADIVYRIYHDGQPFQNQYLVGWDHRLVKVEFIEDVTSEQIEAAANKLRNRQ